jgi:hypothetical protein
MHFQPRQSARETRCGVDVLFFSRFSRDDNTIFSALTLSPETIY